MSSIDQLKDAITSTQAVVGIVGMGYVGFPLGVAVERAGFNVVGYDLDPSKIDDMSAGRSYLGEGWTETFQHMAASDRFAATSDPAALANCDLIILCVPTPLDQERQPDLTCVIESTKMVAGILRPGQLVILESTTWPGTSREVMLPILEEAGLQHGDDFLLAYSPERENPGDPVFHTASIPKVVGGLDQHAGEVASAFYQKVVCDVVTVSTCEVAEASKIVENVYRCVNIALVNELKVVFEGLGIDVWEVIQASATKPFGFHPFWPGPGLGGHCIPIDPFYLSWRARQFGQEAKFIELAGEINTAMPERVVDRTCEVLAQQEAGDSPSVLVIGVSYKPNVSDIRETPAAPIIESLQDRGCSVSFHDPHCPQFPAMKKHTIDLDSVPLDEAHLAAADVVLIVTDHDAVDWTLIGRHASMVVDTRNAMHGVAMSGRLVKA